MEMSIQQYLEEMKELQKNLLNYIGFEDNVEENYQNFIDLINNQKISENEHSLKLLLHLLTNVSDNHFRPAHFFEKIDKILVLYRDQIKQYFSNKEIFSIFRSNKRILLSLIKENILLIDKSIAKVIISSKYDDAFDNFFSAKQGTNDYYYQFFYPEIKDFLDQNDEKYDDKLDNIFLEKRSIGENDDYISQLIRKDSIDEFISYVKKEDYPLTSFINSSIFETNSFLLSKRPNLIEYSCFFGSIQIFNYLRLNGVKLTPSLWIYAIHGDNPEIFSILEENHIEPDNYNECFIESIKCHHNSISNYIQNNYLNQSEEKNKENDKETTNKENDKEDSNKENDKEDKIKENIDMFFKYHNYNFIQEEFINQSYFYNLCEHDYYSFVQLLLKDKDIDVNAKNIVTIKSYWRPISTKNIEKTPLQIAIENENIEIIDLLLSSDKIDINHEYKTDEVFDILSSEEITMKTILHIAIENGNAEIVKRLLNNDKIDINIPVKITKDWPPESPFAKNIENKTCLLIAIENENVDIINLLVSNEKLDINMLSTSKYAFCRYNPCERKENKKAAIHEAIQKGNIEIIKLLLSNNNLDVNILYNKLEQTDDHDNITEESLDQTPLSMAVENDNIEIVKLLLENDKLDINLITQKMKFYKEKDSVKFNIMDKPAIFFAIEKENIEMLKLLLSNDKLNINLKIKVNDGMLKGTSEKCTKETSEKTALFAAIEQILKLSFFFWQMKILILI